MNYDYLLQSFFIIDKRLRIIENFEQVIKKSVSYLNKKYICLYKII